MAIKTVEELKREIALLPEQYTKALNRQTQTLLEFEKIKKQIEVVEQGMSLEDNDTKTSLFSDDETEVIKLEAESEKLKLKLDYIESSIEIEIRKSNGKITESYVNALVGNDEKVYQLRNELIESRTNVKIKKAELQRERKENRNQVKEQPVNNKLNRLEEKLLEAKEQKFSADDEVEILKVKLETFRLLVGIESLKSEIE